MSTALGLAVVSVALQGAGGLILGWLALMLALDDDRPVAEARWDSMDDATPLEKQMHCFGELDDETPTGGRFDL